MIYKLALCEVTPFNTETDDTGNLKMVKTASGKISITPGSDKAKIIEAEIKKHPTALFFRAKAIKADEANSNGDYFSEEEILKSYKSFEGVPFFTNHDNQDIEKARGKIIYAEWVPEEKAVYTIAFVDREAYPHICRGIEEEYASGVSMGASIDYSICNICGNRAEKTEDYCWHIRERKGRKFSGKAKNVVTGEMKEFKDHQVFEYNYGIKFIELSGVVDPACPSCRIEGIIDNNQYLKKVANIQNTLFMYKEASIEKQASKEEIDQLNTALEILENIAISLIKNRKQVEPEFASDLVSILSELQKFSDELIGAGYGNVQPIPGVGGDMEGTQPPLPQPSLQPSLQPSPQPQALPVAETTPMPQESQESVGTISGAPTNPLVNAPKLPITAPIKPRAEIQSRITRISGLIENLKNNLEQEGDENMAKRRTISEKIEQQKIASETLSNSWKEKQEFLRYISKVPDVQNNLSKLSVRKKDDSFIIIAENKNESENLKTWTYETLSDEERSLIKESPKDAAVYLLNTFAKSLNNKKEGVRIMSSNIKEAGAASVNKNPEVVQEAQLEKTRGLYHQRTDDTPNSITQKQLEEKREGEKTVITEKQLQDKSNKLNPRTEEMADEVTEAQLKGLREDGTWNEITQAQLDANGNRTGNEPNVITEKQLSVVDAPWSRAANRDNKLFKSAAEHMAAVVDVIATASISTGCTPDEACEVAGSLVGSTKDRYELANAILDNIAEEDIDYGKRLAYWSKKNVKVAGSSTKDIAEAIVSGLRKVSADTTINPETILDAVDVVSEDSVSSGVVVSKKIDEMLKAAEQKTVKVNRKAELRAALDSQSGKDKREEERKEILAALEKPVKTAKKEVKADTIIETSFEEMGFAKENKAKPEFKFAIKTFAKGALLAKNIKLAAITNVTIDGSTIQIAVQTDEGNDSVEIPVDGANDSVMPEETVPETDMAGEGAGAALPPLPAPIPGTPPTTVASNKSMKKTAQTPMGGGMPNTPGEVAGGPASPEQGLPGAMPGGDAIQTLTQDTEEDSAMEDAIPTAGEQQPLGTICPECGSSDVDVTNEAGNIKGKCNNPGCGAEYEAMIKKEVEYKIIKPSKAMSGEAGIEMPESPEVPALPVAAQTKLNKEVIKRIASNQQKHGHVCPACGMNQCKEASAKDGHVEYTCPACNTEISKDIMVNVNNPEEGYLRVKWDIVPKLAGCKDCKDAAMKLSAMVKVEKMIKSASENADKFPMANCKELIAKKWGGNAVSSFGPCKGKVLAECVCEQLKKLGMTKVRHLDKLASVSMQEDPMEKCIKDHMEKNFGIKEATHACNCLKNKYASKADTNIFIQAFADEPNFNESDLDAMNDSVVDEGPVDDVDVAIDTEPVIDETEISDAKVTLELSKETAQELADAAVKATEPESVEVEVEDTADLEIPEPEIKSEEKDMAIANTSKTVKTAAQPKLIETVEKNVDAGVPRAKATLGNEGPDNIDVAMNKPSVPRASAEMGGESKKNVNKPAGLPDVAVDSGYMGKEKEVQSGMPAINNEIKGTVIAKDDKTVKEAKKMKEIETVEKNVDSGVPRAKATIGNEGPDNVDVKENKPNVPRANAEMGEEGAANINPKAESPDVPVDSAYMGGEKEVQKNMPAINDEMLKNVTAKRETQLERIAAARRLKAVEVAAKLLATKRIQEEAYEDVIDSLSNFEIDKIAVKAEIMYPKVKTASAQPKQEEVYSGPAIVMESKEIKTAGSSLKDKLTAQFTIGNKSFDEKLTMFGEK